MRYRLVGLSFSLVCSIVTSGALSAQEATNKPAMASQDLTGVWNLQMSPGGGPGGSAPDEPPMTAWAVEKFKANKPSFGPRAVEDSNDPVNPTALGTPGCFPPGVPRIYLQPFPMEIIQTPGRVVMFF